MVTKCISQLNTAELEVAMDRYANPANNPDAITETYGTPNRLRRWNIGGAWPASDSEQRVRDDRKRNDRPEATDEKKIAMLTIIGKI